MCSPSALTSSVYCLNIPVRHEAAAGPAGDAAGTWAWDGADDMKLNGYNGGAIEAAGKLNVSYEGDNIVTNGDGRGIKVKDGANENAELNIQATRPARST